MSDGTDALSIARQATNGWACYARTKRELDEIARLHREIDVLAALTPPPPAGGTEALARRIQEIIRVQPYDVQIPAIAAEIDASLAAVTQALATAEQDYACRDLEATDAMVQADRARADLVAVTKEREEAKLKLRLYENGAHVNQPLVDDIERWRVESEQAIKKAERSRLDALTAKAKTEADLAAARQELEREKQAGRDEALEAVKNERLEDPVEGSEGDAAYSQAIRDAERAIRNLSRPAPPVPPETPPQTTTKDDVTHFGAACPNCDGGHDEMAHASECPLAETPQGEQP